MQGKNVKIIFDMCSMFVLCIFIWNGAISKGNQLLYKRKQFHPHKYLFQLYHTTCTGMCIVYWFQLYRQILMSPRISLFSQYDAIRYDTHINKYILFNVGIQCRQSDIQHCTDISTGVYKYFPLLCSMCSA